MMCLFCGFILCLAVVPQPGLLDDALNAVPETDDDRLNQALILVDILKSAYLKLLRERSETVATSTGVVEQPTCAATTAYSSPVETSTLTQEQSNKTLLSSPNANREPVMRGRPHNPSPVYPWGWPMPGTTAITNRFFEMQQPVQPQYPNLFPLRRRPFRRNFPDYSYYYGPYRKYEYYDENREVTTRGHYRRNEDIYDHNRIEEASGIPEIVTTNTAAVTQKKLSTEKTSTRLDPDISQRRFYSGGRRSYYQNRRQLKDKANDKKTDKGTSTNDTNKRGAGTNGTHTNETNKKATTGTNVTNTTATSTKGTFTNTSVAPNKIYTLKTKATTLASKAVWPAFRFKTTLKIFLENSTPLPIPLPENNAFCFTNPNNALCRSP